MPHEYFHKIEEILSGPNPSKERRDLDEHAEECEACTRKLAGIGLAIAPAGAIPVFRDPNDEREKGTANGPLLEHVRLYPGQTT